MHPVFSKLSPKDRKAAYALFMSLPRMWTPIGPGPRMRAVRHPDNAREKVGFVSVPVERKCCPLGAVNLLFAQRAGKTPWEVDPTQLYPSSLSRNRFLFPVPGPKERADFITRWGDKWEYDDPEKLKEAMGAA